MATMTLTPFEIGIFILYLVTVIVIGFVSGRKGKESTSDFFLAGRGLPWFVIGFSLIASSISSEQFIGEVGWGYKYGMAVANWEWLVWPAQGLLLFIFLPVYLKNKIFTIPEYLTRRFGRLAGSTFALVCMIQYLVINLPLVLYSGGFVIHKVFGMNLYLAIWILVIAAGSYTIFGGLSAVAWVDLFNGVLLIGGGLLVFILGVLAVDGGFSAIVGTGERAHLILPADHPELPWTGMLAVAFVMSGYYYSTNQFITQRCLAAKNVWHGKMGVILAAFLAIPLALSVTWPGMIAYALNPNLAHPDDAYPFLIKTLIPVGLRGFMFAVLIGAIMSTIDSLVNSTSSLLTLDIYKGLIRKKATDRQLVKFAQLSGIGLLVFGAVWSPMVGKFGSIFSYAQDCWALMLAPVMAVFIMAIFWRGMTKVAAIATLFMAVPMLLIVFLREMTGMLASFNIFNLSAIIFLISLGFIAIISRLTTTPSAGEIESTLWTPALLKPTEEELAMGYPWWKRIGFWFTVLVLCFTIIYAIFW
ncbi:sodium/solute symporter [candidate division KSB1 bacterium]|nr:sodium/solute symporter [candidate division KSB1 bacterium]